MSKIESLAIKSFKLHHIEFLKEFDAVEKIKKGENLPHIIKDMEERKEERRIMMDKIWYDMTEEERDEMSIYCMKHNKFLNNQ